ncbi:MAG: squalene synthase HpnC [Bacteroidetes bacterium]|nr:squalene synthase HpnC [Bacteroidota bacterium]
MASYFIPKKKRNFMYSIYAFARTGDNIADSIYLKPQDKIDKLDEMAELVMKLDEDRIKNDLHFRSVFTALHDTIEKISVNRQDLIDLLTAFKQDAVKSEYNSYEEIINYSNYSANPVGRLVLTVFGYDREKDKALFEMSDKICTALQLANFWQDVSRDLKMNRIYVPKELMDKYHYDRDKLYERVENDNFKKMMNYLVEETEKLFGEGRKLPSHLKGRLKFELRAIISGGRAVLKYIRKINYKVLSKRVKIGRLRKIQIALKSLFYV